MKKQAKKFNASSRHRRSPGIVGSGGAAVTQL